MQKMSDDLFKIKTKEKNEEEKSSITGSKNPNDSNKSNAYHKINEMDLFEEINTSFRLFPVCKSGQRIYETISRRNIFTDRCHSGIRTI